MTLSPVKFSIFLSIACSLYVGGSLYPGTFLSYIIFSTFFCGFLIFSFYLNSFFTIFIAGLLWLGFWVKSGAAFILREGRLFEAVGQFGYSAKEWDFVLLVSIIGLLGFIFSSLIYKYFSKEILVNSKHHFLARNGLKSYFIILFGLAVLIGVINFNYSVYQKAGRGGAAPILIELTIKWFLLFGLNAVAITFFYRVFCGRERKWFVYLIGLMLIDWIINLSLLSRGFFLSSGALLFCFYWLTYKSGRHLKFYYWCGAFAVYILLAISSVIVTNYLRQMKFEDKGLSATLDMRVVKENSLPGLQLFFGRWVGLEGVASVTSSSEVGSKLLIEGLSEQKDLSRPSFYDRAVVNADTPYSNVGETKHYAINLPGLIGFSYYSGSLIFVFASCLIAGFLGLLIERLALLVSCNNFMFSGFVAYLVAYRYVSFGYAPRDSYMFLSSLMFAILLISILEKWGIKK